MVKLGRNDRCHCGSGKKYKKCCLEKDKQSTAKRKIPHQFHHLLTYEEVEEMSTDEITDKLGEIGIPFHQEEFLQDVKKFNAAEDISENWFRQYAVTATGRDEDFPWLAAWILWERLAQPTNLSMEQMSDLLSHGYDYLDKGDSISACDSWLQIWDIFKRRYDPAFKTLEHLEEQYSRSFFISDFCQDLEMELHNAGLRDSAYFEKRIHFCREFCDMFPEEDELIIHNMRRAIADSYGKLGKYKLAESEFEKMIQDFPENPWSYIAWGDMYFLGQKKDSHKAHEMYEKALEVAKDEWDAIAARERLDDLQQE